MAGAVLITAIMAVIIGLIIFLPYLPYNLELTDMSTRTSTAAGGLFHQPGFSLCIGSTATETGSLAPARQDLRELDKKQREEKWDPDHRVYRRQG